MKICGLLLLVFSLVSFAEGQPVKKHGPLRVDGIQLKDNKGKPLTLRGMSFGWHNFHPRFYTAGSVHALYKDWSCSVVRASMGIEPKGGYLQNPQAGKEKIKIVVDAAIKEGVYVIIDWHSHDIHLEEAKRFFTEMAQTYGWHPNIIYEIFNEPDQESWPEVKQYSIELIKTIRSIDPDNIILVGSPHWDQDIHLVADDPIVGVSNIMYTLHFYAATHKQQLRGKADYALEKKLPLFISESAGMEASGDGAINEEEWIKWIEWAEKKKISWITWSVSDKKETCSVLLPSADSNGKWNDLDIKESGLKARSLIKKYSSRNK